jgi:MFS family permease
MTGIRASAGSYGRLLRHPVLRRVLPGMLISALGDGMSMVAVAWLALAIAPPGQAAMWISLAVAGYALPAPLGAALLAGVMRRLTASQLVAADATLRAASLGTVAVLAAAGRLTPLVYVLLLAVSSLLHAWGSAGTYTLIAEVLPEPDRVAGNALLSTFNQAAFILGPALAGGLTALTGPGWVIGADAASFAVLAIACWRAATPPTTGNTQAAESTSGGWRVILDRPRLLGLILVTCGFFLLYGPVEVALPVHVAEGLHGSPSLLGLYWTVFGIGATIGALGAAALRNSSLWKVVAWIIIGWGAALLPLGLTQAVVPGLIGLAAGGLIYGPFSAISTALFQAATPPQALSRVLAVRTALTTPATALGTLLGGPAVTILGGQRTLLLSALLTIALGAAVAFAVRQRRRDAYPALTPETQPQ